jgi:hypothetical protein
MPGNLRPCKERDVVVANVDHIGKVVKPRQADYLGDAVALDVENDLFEEYPCDGVLAANGVHGRDDKIQIINILSRLRLLALVYVRRSRTVK